MAAAQNVLGGRRGGVDRALRQRAGPGALARTMCDSLPVPTETFDPLAVCPLAPQFASAAGTAGPLPPLLGSAAGRSRSPRPRHRFSPSPPPPAAAQPPQAARAGAGRALLLAVVFVWQGLSKGRLQLEIDRLQEESDALDRQVTKADKIKQGAGEIANWTAGEIIWLDELRQLCQDFPPAEDAMLTQLSMGGVSAGHGGELKLEGLAKTAASIDALEQGLRDKAHHVEGKGRNLDNSQKIYSWRFVSSLFVDAENADGAVQA